MHGLLELFNKLTYENIINACLFFFGNYNYSQPNVKRMIITKLPKQEDQLLKFSHTPQSFIFIK